MLLEKNKTLILSVFDNDKCIGTKTITLLDCSTEDSGGIFGFKKEYHGSVPLKDFKNDEF